MDDLKWCIDYLADYNKVRLPSGYDEKDLFRALQNITLPKDLSEEFYVRQDNVLKEIISVKRITEIESLKKSTEGFYLYKGDITLLRADAIVNAANDKMLGCFIPNHRCIDNAIHSFAGLQVRRDMMDIMEKQGHDEPNGTCKVTPSYNLPSKYIFHTVGPIYSGKSQDETDLKNCYLSCLKTAQEMQLDSIAFCCISTGEFRFPNRAAAEIAVSTVKNFIKSTGSKIKIIFNVFKEIDNEIYNRLLF